MDCQAVRSISLDAKYLFIDYRMTVMIIHLTIINLVLRYIKNHVITKLTLCKFHSSESNDEIAIRFMQLLFGTIVGFSGYSMLLFNGVTGCNASERFLFYSGGNILIFMDLHEYVLRWPLRAPVLGHHIMVFFFGLAMIEYFVLPADFNGPLSWSTVLIVANIGFMWITDFFHVIYRVSTSLQLIERMRKAYLVASIVRPITFCLMIYGSIESAMEGSFFGAVPIFLMALAYGYNLYKAISFVLNFNCDRYFQSHQTRWLVDEEVNEIKKDVNDSSQELNLTNVDQTAYCSSEDGEESKTKRKTEVGEDLP